MKKICFRCGEKAHMDVSKHHCGCQSFIIEGALNEMGAMICPCGNQTMEIKETLRRVDGISFVYECLKCHHQMVEELYFEEGEPE